MEAIEALLVERGLITSDVVDAIVETYEHDVGPMNGARVVARAWVDPEYRARLLDDGTSAVGELGFGGAEGEHLVVLENTEDVHHVVVCTLCSCYPWPVLGLPPQWYKSFAYRSRMVREPRAVLAEFGTTVPDDVEMQVWDSSAEVRYMVLPLAPDDVDGTQRGRAGRPRHPRPHDRRRPVTADQPPEDIPRSNGELVFDAPWESRAFGLAAAYLEASGQDWAAFRAHLMAAIADLPDATPYYEAWVVALDRLLATDGLAARGP